jgi:hypothetical protein
VLLLMTHGREREITEILNHWGFLNCHNIASPSEAERFNDAESLTVLLCKEII